MTFNPYIKDKLWVMVGGNDRGRHFVNRIKTKKHLTRINADKGNKAFDADLHG